MPSFTAAQSARMLNGGGSGFRTVYSVSAPNVGNGVGWHKKTHFNAATGLVDSEYHTLIISAEDTAIPYEILTTKDSIRITVNGVADGGGNLEYNVDSIMEMGNGFRQLSLTPIFQTPIVFPNITIPNQTAGVESSGITLSASGIDDITFGYDEAMNTRARISNSTLFVTGQSAGSASITLVAETVQFEKKQNIIFQVV